MSRGKHLPSRFKKNIFTPKNSEWYDLPCLKIKLCPYYYCLPEQKNEASVFQIN